MSSFAGAAYAAGSTFEDVDDYDATSVEVGDGELLDLD